MISTFNEFLASLEQMPFQNIQENYIRGLTFTAPFLMYKAVILRQRACFAFLKKSYVGLSDKDLTSYACALSNNIAYLAIAIRSLKKTSQTNYCTVILGNYYLYLTESLEDLSWNLSYQNIAPSIESVKRLFDLLFNPEKKRANKHTPYKKTLETLFEEMLCFCDSIHIDANKALQSKSVEALMESIKNADVDRIQIILRADPSMLSKVYPLNNCMEEIGFTPLMYAAKHSNANLMRNGMFVMLKGKKEVIYHLSNKIQDANSEYDNYSVMMIAARWGKSCTFEYLLSFMTAKAIKASFEKIINAIVEPYLYVAAALSTFAQIKEILESDTIDIGKINTLISDCIFSDNINLGLKLKTLACRLANSPSPTLELDRSLPSLIRFFSPPAQPLESGATNEDSRYPKRQKVKH